MNIKKRLFSAILACISGIVMLCPGTAWAEFTHEKVTSAEYVFTTPAKNTNFLSVSASNSEYVEKDGKNALVRTPDTEEGLYLYMKLPEDFMNKDGFPVYITVEYFDEGNGSFTFSYSGPNDDPEKYGHSHTNAPDIVKMENTMQWKTYTFYIEDCSFAHTYVGGNDMRLGLWADEMGRSTGDVYIHSVKIEKAPAKAMTVGGYYSDYQGNIFGPGEDKTVSIDLENRKSFPLNGTAEYIAKDYYGNEVLKGSMDVELPAGEVATVNIDLNEIDVFGVYRIYTDFKFEWTEDGKEEVFEVSKEGDFSYVNKPDIKNPRVNVQTHGTWYGEEAAATAADWAGFGSVRDEIRWRYVEQAKGSLSIPVEHEDYLNFLQQRNVGFYLELAFGNWLYDGGTASRQMVPPTGEENLDGWERYCEFVAASYPDYLKEFEVWNEYNITAFNELLYEGGTPENYVEMAKRASRAVKKHIPDAKIFGGGLAGANSDYMRSLLEAGLYDYVDGFSCHPYDWTGHFRNQNFIDVMKEFRATIEEYGPIKPLYLTELGMNDGTEAATGVPTLEKAGLPIQIFSLMVGENLADKWFWYDLIKSSGNITDQETNFGLVKAMAKPENDWTAYAATPAYVTFAGLNYMLTDAEPAGSLVSEDGYTRSYRFKSRFGDDIATAWSEYGVQNAAINLGCSEVEIYDMYSNLIDTMHSDTGVYSFTLDYMPIYIKGNFNEFAFAENEVSPDIISGVLPAGETMHISFTDTQGRDLSIEPITVEGGVTVDTGEGIKGGQGEVAITSDGTEGEYKVTFLIFDNEGTVARLAARLTVGKPIEGEITGVEQVDSLDDTRWQAMVRVKNLSTEAVLNGTLSPAEITESDSNIRSVPIVELKPGEERTLYMNLPKMTKRRIMDLSYIITLDDGNQYPVTGEVDFTVAKYTKTKPVIDGTIDQSEWNGIWLTADEEKNAITLINDRGWWGGPDDISATFNLMWDEENFYMAAKVTDNIFSNQNTPDTAWAGDSLQFAIEDNMYQYTYFIDGAGSTDVFTEMCFSDLPTGLSIYRYRGVDTDLGVGEIPLGESELAVTREGNQTLYELSIPWSELFGEEYEIDPSKIYGFAIVLNDNDGSDRLGYLEYYTGLGKDKNAALFGKLRLEEPQ